MRNFWMKALLCVGWGVVALPVFADEQQGWELHAESDGVRVYLREVEGERFKQFRATVEIKAAPETVFAWIKDVSGYCQWTADCGGAVLLQQVSANEEIAHLISDAPWPVQDRDTVFHRRLSETQQGGLVPSFVAEAEHLPLQDCCIRVQHAYGVMRVDPTERAGVSQMTYELFADPAGRLPSWLANYVVTEAPVKTLQNLRALVEK